MRKIHPLLAAFLVILGLFIASCFDTRKAHADPPPVTDHLYNMSIAGHTVEAKYEVEEFSGMKYLIITTMKSEGVYTSPSVVVVNLTKDSAEEALARMRLKSYFPEGHARK